MPFAFSAVWCGLFIGLGGCGQGAGKGPFGRLSAQVAAPSVVETGPAVSEEDTRAFADSFEKAIASGDQDAGNRLIDWDAVIETSLAGLDAPKILLRPSPRE